MGVIFAKHLDSDKEYLFLTRQGQDIKTGNYLWVDTIRGRAVAIATSGVIEGDISKLLEITGAYAPLKPVITYANTDMINAIRHIEKFVKFTLCSMHNPDSPFD